MLLDGLLHSAREREREKFGAAAVWERKKKRTLYRVFGYGVVREECFYMDIRDVERGLLYYT